MNEERLTELFSMDGSDRGISFALDHVLGLGILLIMVSVVGWTLIDYQNAQEEAAHEQEFERIAEEVQAALHAIEATAQQSSAYADDAGSADGSTTTQYVHLPHNVGDISYNIFIEEDGGITSIIIEGGPYEYSVTTTLTSDVATASLTGGQIIIEHDGDEITFSDP